MSLEEKERKNKRVGAVVSVGIHSLIILLFFFLIAWRAPNPPNPEIGIELNFGVDDAGTGDTQPETPAAATESTEEAAPDAPEKVEEEVPEEINDITEKTEETTQDKQEPQEVREEEVKETPVDQTKTVPAEEVTQQESPDVVTPPKKAEEKIVKPTPKPPPVLYPGKKEGAQGKSGKTNQAPKSNQGDQVDKTGDQGNPEGTIDARSLYGKPGGGGGSSLEMAGWIWDREPNPKETTSESGKIVFTIVIDDKGEIVSVKPLQYTVSVSLMKIYQAEVERLTFRKTSSSAPPPRSSGKITFIIKAR